MNDLISRQAAIDAMDGALLDGLSEGIAKEILSELPAAEPRNGKWVYDEERCATGIYAICTACDEVIYQTGDLHYCPNCGAKMED